MYFVMKTDSSGGALRMTRNIYCHTERSEVAFFGGKFLLRQEPTCNCLFAEFTNIVKTDSSGAALRMTLCFLPLLPKIRQNDEEDLTSY